MTDIYLHIDARMADYIRTHPYVGAAVHHALQWAASARPLGLHLSMQLGQPVAPLPRVLGPPWAGSCARSNVESTVHAAGFLA